MKHMTTNNNRHITLFASLGSTLEYFDFVIFGMMAAYLSAVFFPLENSIAATLQSFLVFAVGYFARPLGGTFIGVIGDRMGRKPAFLMSTGLMACSTLLIAFLPSYQSMGMVAVALLVFLRILQGLSFGGELPGAMTIVGEFSHQKQQGSKTSLVMTSTSLAALLASGTLYMLSAFLTNEQIIEWGWRVPFLVGGMLGLLLLIARKKLSETPAFESINKSMKNKKPLGLLFKNYKLNLARGSALCAFMAALIITNLYFPYFIPKYFSYEINDVYMGTTFSLIFLILVLPSIGKLADLLPNKTSTLQFTCLSYIVLSVPIFSLLSTGNTIVLFLFLIIQQIYIALFSANFFPTLIQLFPPEVRYTGIALCYNFTWATMATLPMLYTYVLKYFASPWDVPIMLSTIAAISLTATRGIIKLNSNLLTKETDSIQFDMADCVKINVNTQTKYKRVRKSGKKAYK
jgi:MHS family proline/betaine transporter-like MFS transporter